MSSNDTWRRGVTVLALVLALSVGAQRVAMATDWGAVLGGLAVGALVYGALDDQGHGHHHGGYYYDYGYSRGCDGWGTTYGYGWGSPYYGGWDTGFGYGRGYREPVSRGSYGWDGYYDAPRPPRHYEEPRGRGRGEFRGGRRGEGPPHRRW